MARRAPWNTARPALQAATAAAAAILSVFELKGFGVRTRSQEAHRLRCGDLARLALGPWVPGFLTLSAWMSNIGFSGSLGDLKKIFF